MSKIWTMIAALAALLAVAATVSAASTTTIKIGDNWFVSSSKNGTVVKLSKGSRIKWHWTGESGHEVRLKSAPSGVSKSRFKISERDSGTRTSPVLTKPGTYKFICPIHDYDNQGVTVKVHGS